MARPPRPSTSTIVLCQGPLVFAPSTDEAFAYGRHSMSSPPSGALFGVLRGAHLHLHRGDPFSTSEDELHDGAEVLKIAVRGKGWTTCRRGKGAAVVLEKAEPALDGLTQQAKAKAPKTLTKKRSTPGLQQQQLAESTNVEPEASRLSFADKLAMRMGKRAKSISSTTALFALDADDAAVAPLTFDAQSTADADRWVEALNLALTTSFDTPPMSPTARIPNSASLPGNLSSFAEHRAAAGRPQTAADGLPPSFNPARRPSFLDRPPPSPRNYVTLTLASPPQTPSAEGPADVPAWIQAVRSAAATAASAAVLAEQSPVAPSPASTPPPPSLTKKASASLLRNSTDRRSVSMEASRSDEGHTEAASGGMGGKIFGFLGGKKSKKDGDAVSQASSRPSLSADAGTQPKRHLHPSLSPHLPHGLTRSSSSTSLSDSLSESHSTSAASSDLPLTPEMAEELSSASFSSHGKALSTPPLGFSSLSHSSFIDTPDRRPQRALSPRPRGSDGHHSRFSSGVSSDSRFTMERSSSSTDFSGSPSTFTTLDSDASFDGSLFDAYDSPVPRQRREEWRSTFGRRVTSSTDLGPRRQDGATPSPRAATAPSAAGGGDYIVKPSELISQMREEAGWEPRLASKKSHGMFGDCPSPSEGSFGGLSPAPPRHGSRQSLASIAMGRSASRPNLIQSSPSRARLAEAEQSGIDEDGDEGGPLSGPPVTPRAPARRRSTAFGGSGDADDEVVGPGDRTPTRRVTLTGPVLVT